MDIAPISSHRLSLVALDADTLTRMASGQPSPQFRWPAWWPDADDRRHLTLWRRRAIEAGSSDWGPRAVVTDDSTLIGHAGFHLPPQPITAALADPTFDGVCDDPSGSAVEVGYTIFPEHRRRGYATEVLTALVTWAWATSDVRSILASVAEGNRDSVGVLKRVGDFRVIGSCRTSDGTRELVYRLDR
jgi:RimJ/RimL family protein N-acetyltransferase